MGQKDNSSLLFLSGIILGAVVGGTMGILFAPEAGEKTRKKLTQKGKKVWKEVQEEAKEVGERLEPKIKKMKKEISKKVDELQAGFEKGVKTASK